MTRVRLKMPVRARVHVDPPAPDGSSVVQVRLFGPRGVIVLDAADVRPNPREEPGELGRCARILGLRIEPGSAVGRLPFKPLQLSDLDRAELAAMIDVFATLGRWQSEAENEEEEP